MKTTDKIVDRLPGFYRAREKKSFIYDFVDGIAKVIDVQKENLSSIRNSHWIDSASGIDLELLASLFGITRKRRETDEEYRSRIKKTFADFKRGGTVEAIRTQLAAFLGISKEEITLIENPPMEIQDVKKVISGETWTMSSVSIYDEKGTITLYLEEGEASNPMILDLDTNSLIRYNGVLRKGQSLEIYQGKAKLNGIDATKLISFESGKSSSSPAPPITDMPIIPRKPSKWVFRERLTETLGRFDQSKFNENIFFKPVPPTTLKLKWTARLLASFEIKISSKVLDNNNLTKQELEALVNAIKAAGVRTSVTVMSDNEQLITVREGKMDTKPAPATLSAGP